MRRDREPPSWAPSRRAPLPGRTDASDHASLLRSASRAGVAVWAGAWTLFLAWRATGDGSGALGGAAATLLGVALCAFVVWTRPLLGGVLLNAAGVAAAVALEHPAARALLAAPAVVLGVMALSGAVRGRAAAGRCATSRAPAS